MKMKITLAILLLMLTVVWSFSDFGNGDDSKKDSSVQSTAKSLSQLPNCNGDCQIVMRVRKKRWLGSLIGNLATLSKEFIRLATKTVPRIVSPLAKTAKTLGTTLQYVELGIAIVQVIQECPTQEICTLRDELKDVQNLIQKKTEELKNTHNMLDECYSKAYSIKHHTSKIIHHVERISKSFGSIHELQYVDDLSRRCAEINDTVKCVYDVFKTIETVATKMEDEINDVRRSRLTQAIVNFVSVKAIETVVKIVKESLKSYNSNVSKFGKQEKFLERVKMRGKSLKFGTRVVIGKSIASASKSVLSPVQTIGKKFRIIGRKALSVKHRLVNFKHGRWSRGHLSKYSVRSVLGRLSVGVLESALGAFAMYTHQKQYRELEDEMRTVINQYKNHFQELNNMTTNGNELQLNCTSELDLLIDQFRNLTEAFVEILDLFDEMLLINRESEIDNLTESQIKIRLYRNVSSVLLSDIDKANIHKKQNQLLEILNDDLFNLTEMESWAKTENAVFDMVKKHSYANTSILNITRNLNVESLTTNGRDEWPLKDVLCSLAVFHPSYSDYDHYNMNEIRSYCIEGNFSMDTVLLQRKNAFVQEKIRSYVEHSTKQRPALIADMLSNSLSSDEYMESVGGFPDEKEVLCIVANKFPQLQQYGFYDLSDFRPRHSCNTLTDERFDQLKKQAISSRNRESLVRMNLSPVFFNDHLRKELRKGLIKDASISIICQNVRNQLNLDDIQREASWPIKQLLCVLGSVIPPEKHVYDHYPIDVIRHQCHSGTLQTSQLQDILLRRKENLLEINIRYHVDLEEEENPEAIVKDIAGLLMSDPIMASLNIVPTEHEIMCMIADFYPDKEEYGMYKLTQFRPMEICEQITEQGFQILKGDSERRKFQAMFHKYCSGSDEPCFPMTGDEPVTESPVHSSSMSGTSCFHTTRNLLFLFTVFTTYKVL